MSDTTIKGTVYVNEKGVINRNKPVSQARILRQDTGEIQTTNSKGEFSIAFEDDDPWKEIKLVILPPKLARLYQPRHVALCELQVPQDPTEEGIALSLPEEDTCVSELWLLPRIGTFPGVQSVFGWTLEKWTLSSWKQKLAVAGAALPLLCHMALDFGLPLPTDADDYYREFIQRRRFLPTMRPEVSFTQVRTVYYPGIEYRLPKGKYVSPSKRCTIKDGATLTIDKGTEIEFPPGGGLFVSGKLVAIGSDQERIQFKPKGEDGSWQNITIEGGQSIGSILEYCTVRGGGGMTAPEGSYGGGLLLRDTKVSVKNCKFEKCSAFKGGGIFISNTEVAPGQQEHKGSFFDHVEITGCTAKNSTGVAGGGALFIVNTFPEFSNCKFTNNVTATHAACGGAIYVATKARARFTACTISENTAYAEGGGVYVYNARHDKDEHMSGVTFVGGEISKNTADGTGGGISTVDSRIFLSGVKLTGNTVNPSPFEKGETLARGGAVYLQYTKPEVVNSKDSQSFPASGFNGCYFSNNKVIPIGNNQGLNPDPMGEALFVKCSDSIKKESLAKVEMSSCTLVANKQGKTRSIVVPRINILRKFENIRENDIPVGPEIVAIYTTQKFPPPPINLSRLKESPAQGSKREIRCVVVGASRSHPETIQEYVESVDPSKAPPGLPHYAIDATGEIHALVEPSEKATMLSQNISFRSFSDISLDDVAVYVEFLCGRTNGPNQQQVKSFAELAKMLRNEYDLKPFSIVGRGFIDYAAGRTSLASRDAEAPLDWGHMFELISE